MGDVEKERIEKAITDKLLSGMVDMLMKKIYECTEMIFSDDDDSKEYQGKRVHFLRHLLTNLVGNMTLNTTNHEIENAFENNLDFMINNLKSWKKDALADYERLKKLECEDCSEMH